MVTVNAPVLNLLELHFRSFWSAPRTATSGRVQHRMSAIHGLLVILRMLRVKCDKSDWFQSLCCVCKANQNRNLTGPIQRS